MSFNNVVLLSKTNPEWNGKYWSSRKVQVNNFFAPRPFRELTVRALNNFLIFLLGNPKYTALANIIFYIVSFRRLVKKKRERGAQNLCYFNQNIGKFGQSIFEHSDRRAMLIASWNLVRHPTTNLICCISIYMLLGPRIIFLWLKISVWALC